MFHPWLDFFFNKYVNQFVGYLMVHEAEMSKLGEPRPVETILLGGRTPTRLVLLPSPLPDQG